MSDRTPEDDMDRDEAVTYLTANCDCWKGEGAEEVLNVMEDEQVVSLAENALVVNALREEVGDESDLKTILNRLKYPPKPAKMTGEEEEEDEEEEMPKKPTKNRDRDQPMTDDEFLAVAPPKIKRLIANAEKADKRERRQSIGKLIANVAPGKLRDRLLRRYEKLDTETLADLAAAVPVPRIARNADPDDDDDDDDGVGTAGTRTRNRLRDYDRDDDEDGSRRGRRRDADYSGAGYVGNRDDDDRGPPESEPLMPVTVNWEQVREQQRKEENGKYRD